MKKIKIPIEISARHCHLSKEDLEKLFGGGPSGSCELTKIKQLSQPSDFACQETITIKSNSHILENVRVIGPLRSNTQVEISKTDAIFLGIDTPLRLSGDLKGSGAIKLVGPKGEVDLLEGLIIAKRHLHCATNEAKELKLKNGSAVCIEVGGDRAIIFENVTVRTGDNYKLCLHLDTDEGNSAGINKTAQGLII